LLKIERPDAKKLPRLTTFKTSGQSITLQLSNPATEVTAYWKNFSLPVVQKKDQLIIPIPDQAKKEVRSHVRVWAANETGISNDVLIPLQNGEVILDAAMLTRQDKDLSKIPTFCQKQIITGATLLE
jgi:hypothetical protein